MKLCGSNKSKITKDESDEDIPNLGVLKQVVYCNIVNNKYQKDSIVFYTFMPNKLFGQLLDVSPKDFIFSYIEVWFTN